MEENSSQDKLSFLFEELRNETPKTSSKEIEALLISVSAGAIALGIIGKLKLVFIKNWLIMTLSGILVRGAVVTSLYFGGKELIKKEQTINQPKGIVSESYTVEKKCR